MNKSYFLLVLTLLLFVVTQKSFAQYTEVINSNNPGFSESPYSVGSGVYQFESNLFYRNTGIVPKFTRPQSLGLDMMFRTSFLSERLEFNAHFSFSRDNIAFNNVFTSERFETGLNRFTIGAKYLIFQQQYEDKSKEIRSWRRRNAFDKKRLIPSVAVYAGVNTDMVGDYYKTGGLSPKVGILLQNDLSNQLNIVTNAFYDFIGTDAEEISFIITGTLSLSDRWSTFLENQTIFQKNQTLTNYGTGLAFLYSRDLQINTAVRYLMEGNSRGFYTGLGVSYRINRHRDESYEVDEFGNRIEDSPITKYNKKKGGFFSRMFGIFKKKDKKSKRKRRKRN